MRFLLDENQPPTLARLLDADGHDAVHVSDINMARAPDTEVMARAVADGRVLVSGDTDFADLLARSQQSAPSVLLLRRQDRRSASALFELISFNLPAIQEDLHVGEIVVFDDSRIRVRSLPITN